MNPIRSLYWKMRYEWRLHYLAPVLILALPMLLIWRDPLNLRTEPGEPVEATISQIKVGMNRYQGHTPGYIVIAETAEGITGQKTVLPSDMRGCEIGDEIRAEQKGMKLYLYPSPCED